MKPSKKSSKKPRGKALLLGLGLDAKDGHVRVTKGENYRLVGGSKETHEFMQEKAIKINEELHKRGKAMEEISGEEFIDIASCAGK